MAFCTGCGSQVDEGTRFCQKCGQPMTSAPPAAYAAQPGTTMPAGYGAVSRTKYAGFWIRFVAYIVDGLIIGIPTSVIFGLVVFVFGAGSFARLGSLPNNPSPDQVREEFIPMFVALLGAYAMLLIGGFILSWLYFALMESSERQATLGKAIFNMRVSDLNGNRLSFAHASGRFFAKIINNFTFTIGWILAGLTEKKQGLHDIIAGTIVTRTI